MFHVVTGGSGSGKSAYAEQCILDFQGENRIYIATMYPFDEESHRRIARHRSHAGGKKVHDDGTVYRSGASYDTVRCGCTARVHVKSGGK